MANPITQTSIVARTGELLEAQIDNEIVLLDVRGGFYRNLNPVASRIWQLIGDDISVGDLCERICDEYEVDGETCLTQTIALLDEMRAVDMILVRRG